MPVIPNTISNAAFNTTYISSSSVGGILRVVSNSRYEGDSFCHLARHSARFHARYRDSKSPRKAFTRLAFSVRQERSRASNAPIAPADMTILRIGHALDMVSSRAHGLIWKLSAEGGLLSRILPLSLCEGIPEQNILRSLPVIQSVFGRRSSVESYVNQLNSARLRTNAVRAGQFPWDTSG